MDTRSKASSITDANARAEGADDAQADRAAATDPVTGGAPAAEPPRTLAHEPISDDPDSVDRRAFFRVFSRQTVTAVAQVAGMAGAVQRGAAAAVVEAVGIGVRNPEESAARLSAGAAVESLGAPAANRRTQVTAAAGARFASAYRFDDGGLVIVDHRLAPERIEEITCSRAADVAFQMRTFACNGGLLMAQLAAYGLALTANEARGWSRLRRQAELRRSVQLLKYARPSAHPVGVTVARMEALARDAAGPEGEDGDAVATALRAEADAIANEAAATCAAIARTTRDLLRPRDGQPLRLLVVGDPGQMTNGQVGTGVTALQLVRQSGTDLRVWVAEGNPRGEGGRLGSWELRNAGVEHAILPDNALGWLFAREFIDVVLLSVDWIGPSGDAIAAIGARTVAELAASGLGGSETKVIALAPSSAVASEEFDLGRLPDPSKAMPSTDAATGVRVFRPRPEVELLPASRISAFVTERGVHLAPYTDSLPEGH